jgi:hypothetical protein
VTRNRVVRIIGHTFSPFTRKVRIVALEQGIAFPRFPPLEGFERRPPEEPFVSSRHPKTFARAAVQAM